MQRLSDSAAVGRGLSGTVAIMVRTQAKPSGPKRECVLVCVRVCSCVCVYVYVCVRVCGDDVFAASLRRVASHRTHTSSPPPGHVELIDRALDTAIMLRNALVIAIQLKFHGNGRNVLLHFPTCLPGHLTPTS